MSATESEERIYSKVGGWLCLDFTNTIQSYSLDDPNYDYIGSYEDLARWARQAELISKSEEEVLKRQASEMPNKADILLKRARVLRGTINRVFSAIANERQPNEDDLDALNKELGEAMSHARIAQTVDDFTWAWTDFPERMESLLWPVVRSAAELLVSHDKLERVRECGGDSCGWLFVDTSKNRSRRWCDMRDCGNAAKARRHYHRVKAAGGKQ